MRTARAQLSGSSSCSGSLAGRKCQLENDCDDEEDYEVEQDEEEESDEEN